MADTNHHVTARTEGDGISYRGLAVSMIVLTVATLACYGIVVGYYKIMESRSAASDTAPHALAAAPVYPQIEDGRIVSGNMSSTPMLVDEPVNLKKHRALEHETLHSYGWVDQNAGTVRVPIDVAKDLLITQGLPVRGGGR